MLSSTHIITNFPKSPGEQKDVTQAREQRFISAMMQTGLTALQSHLPQVQIVSIGSSMRKRIQGKSQKYVSPKPRLGLSVGYPEDILDAKIVEAELCSAARWSCLRHVGLKCRCSLPFSDS
jgi:hypothetical protein